MTTLVTADEKGRISIRGSKPGQKYLVSQSGGEWRVLPYESRGVVSRNRREWSPPKGKGIFDVIKEMGDEGLRIEQAENAKAIVPLCRF